MRSRYAFFLGLFLLGSIVALPTSVFADWEPDSQASNIGSIANTRHNLSVPYSSFQIIMELGRNDYVQVCVYCHTPHGANSTIDAPLWNRTNLGNTYTVFTDPNEGRPMMSGQVATQPGVSSLTCLSCHDGTVAIDSIINMPGSGGYRVEQETSQNDAFLNTWINPSGNTTLIHMVMGPETSGATNGPVTQCTFCHYSGGLGPDFNLFTIGTDLTNDHPIGIQMPDAVTHGFNEPNTVDGNKWFYDTDSDGRADRNEIRLYDTGDGYEVECASCHDPHGVPVGGVPGVGPLIGTFLRIDNNGSAMCYTCHIK